MSRKSKYNLKQLMQLKLEGKSNRECAEILGCSIPHVYYLSSLLNRESPKFAFPDDDKKARRIFNEFKFHISVAELMVRYNLNRRKITEILMEQCYKKWKIVNRKKQFPMPGNIHQIKIWKYFISNPSGSKAEINHVHYVTGVPKNEIKLYKKKVIDYERL